MLSGIRLYATVLLTGLAIRFEVFNLPSSLSGLELLADPIVLSVAGGLVAVEFLVDKIAWLDSIWDSIHTFIRPLGAMALALLGLSEIDPASEFILVLACGGVALSSHATKAGTRAAVNHSPEPVSNIIVSLVEDVLVVALSWLLFTHPLILLAIVIVFLAIAAYLLPKLYRIVRMQLRCLKSALFSGRESTHNIQLPDKAKKVLDESSLNIDDISIVLPCFTSKGFPWGRHYAGYLVRMPGRVFFIGKRRLRWKFEAVHESGVLEFETRNRFMFNRLIIRDGETNFIFIFEKAWRAAVAEFGK